MRTYLLLNDFPISLITHDCHFIVITDIDPKIITEETVIPLLNESDAHLLKILEAKIGKLNLADNPDEYLESEDKIYGASFSGAIPQPKDSYTVEEVRKCHIELISFDVEVYEPPYFSL